MWFGAESAWKLVDLEHAAVEGQTAAQGSVGAHPPPEFLELQAQEETTVVRLASSADMWSFGVIAFEVLTCAFPPPPRRLADSALLP